MSGGKKLLLFGGRIGTDDEITENFSSIGEFLLRKLELADDKVILVRETHSFGILLYNCEFKII